METEFYKVTMASKQLTPDQLNFTRLAVVCLEVIKLVLKDILNFKIPPCSLYSTIKKDKKTVKLNRDQLELCYKKPPLLPDYEKFDVTLLYALIRNFCDNLKPTNGWGKMPSQMANQIGDDIERLRIFRNNSYGHLNSTSVSNSEMKKQSQMLQNVMGRIQTFMKSNGSLENYMEKLDDALNSHFGTDDMEKCKIELETLMTLLSKERNGW